MTAKIEAIGKLNALGGVYGNEKVHIEADNILLEYLRETGGEAVADAYESLQTRICFYYI
jgi:hypothetical protein